MELRHVRLFCLIMERGSISEAARAASLSQPTVSQHLRALEKELGTILFHRRGRRLVPSQAGEAFYPHAREALNHMDEARRALEDRVGLVRGDLWMAASTIPGHYILPRLMADFRKQYPDVRLHMEVGNSEWVVERVRRHDVELGFVGARWERPGLSFQPVAEDELILVVPRGHPLSGGEAIELSRLPSLPFLSRIRGSGTRTSWEDLLEQAGIDPEGLNIVAELGTTEAILRGIRAGLGVGVVSIWAVEEELRKGDMERVPLEGLRLARTFHAVHSVRQNLSPAAREFLRLAARTGEDADPASRPPGSASGELGRHGQGTARAR